MNLVLGVIKRNVVAYVALVVALSGTAVAAVALPKNSVGSTQLRTGAVTNAKVRAHSLLAGVFARGVLPSAAKPLTTSVVYGPANPPSCTGTSCPSEPTGTSHTEIATCPSGDRALSGGFVLGPGGTADEAVSASTPTKDDTGWQVTFVLTRAASAPVGVVSAVCAAAG